MDNKQQHLLKMMQAPL